MSTESAVIQIPQDVLSKIRDSNRILQYLCDFLIIKHDCIFNKNKSGNNDYAVVSFDDKQAEKFIKMEVVEKAKAIDPHIDYFSEKEIAMNKLSKNPNSALAWRDSPELELMY